MPVKVQNMFPLALFPHGSTSNTNVIFYVILLNILMFCHFAYYRTAVTFLYSCYSLEFICSSLQTQNGNYSVHFWRSVNLVYYCAIKIRIYFFLSALSVLASIFKVILHTIYFYKCFSQYKVNVFHTSKYFSTL